MAPTESSSIVYTMDKITIQHHAKHFSVLRDLRSSSTPTDLTIVGWDGTINIHKKAIQLNSSMPSKTIEKSDALQFSEFTVSELLKVRNYAYLGRLKIPKEDLQRFVIIAEGFGFDALHQLLVGALNPGSETIEIQETENQGSTVTEAQTQDSCQETENGSKNTESLTLNWKQPVVSLTPIEHSEHPKRRPLLPIVSGKLYVSNSWTPQMIQKMLKWWLDEIDKGSKHFPATLLAQKFAAEGHNIGIMTLWFRKQSLLRLYQDYLEGVYVPQIKPFLGYLRKIKAKTNFVKIHHWMWSSGHVEQFLRLWLDAKDKKRFPGKSIAAKLNQLGIKVSNSAVYSKKRELSKKYIKHTKGKTDPKIKPFISLLRQIYSD